MATSTDPARSRSAPGAPGALSPVRRGSGRDSGLHLSRLRHSRRGGRDARRRHRPRNRPVHRERGRGKRPADDRGRSRRPALEPRARRSAGGRIAGDGPGRNRCGCGAPRQCCTSPRTTSAPAAESWSPAATIPLPTTGSRSCSAGKTLSGGGDRRPAHPGSSPEGSSPAPAPAARKRCGTPTCRRSAGTSSHPGFALSGWRPTAATASRAAWRRSSFARWDMKSSNSTAMSTAASRITIRTRASPGTCGRLSRRSGAAGPIWASLSTATATGSAWWIPQATSSGRTGSSCSSRRICSRESGARKSCST